jgi:hypothetical protein
LVYQLKSWESIGETYLKVLRLRVSDYFISAEGVFHRYGRVRHYSCSPERQINLWSKCIT